MKKILIVLGIICIFPATLWAQTQSVSIPQTPSNFVTDLADVLNENEEALLNNQLAQTEKETSLEIAILTVPSLDELKFKGVYHDIDSLGYEVFNTWKIGKNNVDNGVLIVAAINDRVFRIEVGDGAEGALTDNNARIIAENSLVPNFRKSDYYQGLSETATNIEKLLKEDPSIVSFVTEEAQRNDAIDMQGIAGFGIFIAIMAGIMINGGITKISSSTAKAKKRIVTTGIVGFIIGLIMLIINVIILLATFLMLTSIAMILFSNGTSNSSGRSGPTFWGGGGFGGGSSFGGGFGGFSGGSSSGGGFSGGW